MKATVRAVLQSGLVIELEGRKGFVPKRELSWEDWGIKPSDHYEPDKEIEVVPYGAPVGDEPRYSVKRASYDPWNHHKTKYLNAINSRDFIVARGTVQELTPTRAYLVLEDFNNAVLPSDLAFPDGFRQSNRDLTQRFCVGDHVEGRITGLHSDQEHLVLDIRIHLEKLALEFQREDSSDRSWAGTLEGRFAHLDLGRYIRPSRFPNDEEDLTRLRILGVEDNPVDRETLRSILKTIGCSYELPECFEAYEAILGAPGYFDVVLLDKKLERWGHGLRGTQLVGKIRQYHRGIAVTAFSAEEIEDTWTAFDAESGIEVEVQVEQKPYTVEKVENVLKRARGLVRGSSLRAMRMLDQSSKGVKDFLSAGESTEKKLQGVLRSLSQADNHALSAAILRMDTVGHEVECVCNHRLSHIPWPDHKSTLRHTPISDVILYSEPFSSSRLPENRKRHFPGQMDFTSFAGFPVETFGETQHGLFLFGSSSDSITEEVYWRAHNMALVIARLLERSFIDKVLSDEALFSSMGRLYMAMGHEIRDAVTGMEEVPRALLQRIQKLDEVPEVSDLEILLRDVSRGLSALERSGHRILETFDFYADLSRQEKSPVSFDFRTLVENVIDEIKKRHCKNTTFKIVVDPAVRLEASEIKCKQIFRNLMLNAGQQMEEHDWPFSRVYVEAVVDKSLSLPVRIIVRDTGPGIHRKDWERVFQLSYSTRKKGHGLGLYLCKLLARSMGGRITVHESFRFSGTSFLLELPKAVGGRP
ncbi:MAG: ATP-binding protein [Pseudomonadota bacterium]